MSYGAWQMEVSSRVGFIIKFIVPTNVCSLVAQLTPRLLE